MNFSDLEKAAILVLANKYGIDLQAEFVRNTKEISEYVSGELAK